MEPYVGVIHRLDKPVRGVMVYAKNQKAAAHLSRQVQDGKLEKIYQAVVCGKPVEMDFQQRAHCSISLFFFF